jgi:TIR domain
MAGRGIAHVRVGDDLALRIRTVGEPQPAPGELGGGVGCLAVGHDDLDDAPRTRYGRIRACLGRGDRGLPSDAEIFKRCIIAPSKVSGGRHFLADVFISYASADAAEANRLSDLLSDAGYSVWWDKHLVSGQQYQESIKHELAHAGVVLVVWTPSSITSPWVYSEARRGADRQVLVQVRTRELTINDLPAPFDAFHCPYVDDDESVRIAIARLITQPAAARDESSTAVTGTAVPPPVPVVATPLPRFNTTLIGREAELEDLIALFDEGARLVTLTGAGGSGKTRLAVALAERLTKARHGVAAFVSAESVERTEEFWAAIGAAVGAPTEGRLPPGLFEHLRTSGALLVLDNLEQIPTAGDVVADLLEVAPEISIVATRCAFR